MTKRQANKRRDRLCPARQARARLAATALQVPTAHQHRHQAPSVSAASVPYSDIPSNNELGRPTIAPVFEVGDAPLPLDCSIYADQLQCPSPEPIAFVPYTCEEPAAQSIATRCQSAALTLSTRLPAGQYRILSICHSQTRPTSTPFTSCSTSATRPSGEHNDE